MLTLPSPSRILVHSHYLLYSIMTLLNGRFNTAWMLVGTFSLALCKLIIEEDYTIIQTIFKM